MRLLRAHPELQLRQLLLPGRGLMFCRLRTLVRRRAADSLAIQLNVEFVSARLFTHQFIARDFKLARMSCLLCGKHRVKSFVDVLCIRFAPGRVLRRIDGRCTAWLPHLVQRQVRKRKAALGKPPGTGEYQQYLFTGPKAGFPAPGIDHRVIHQRPCRVGCDRNIPAVERDLMLRMPGDLAVRQ
ncbi:hypothetical protein [Paraburkholderia xenovorans]